MLPLKKVDFFFCDRGRDVVGGLQNLSGMIFNIYVDDGNITNFNGFCPSTSSGTGGCRSLRLSFELVVR
jgi:hypothetical protein